MLCGRVKTLPYIVGRNALESVGAIINRPCSRSCVLTLGFGEYEMPAVRAITDRPYNVRRTALESVGAGALDGPFVQSKVFSAGASPRPTSTNAPR